MKNIVLSFLVFACSLCAFGQMNTSDLYGEWNVKSILKKSPNPALRGVMDGFKHATFTFTENGDFHLKTKSKAPAFQMMLRMTKGAKWQFNTEQQRIKIGTEKDGYSIMGIYPTKNDSTLEFSLDESEMVLEMEKIQ